ncbi:MAG TPA: acyl carrier protein [Opitutaceae bacterium]|nr:acyl carrier protein [Opitutaceae bacterium]
MSPAAVRHYSQFAAAGKDEDLRALVFEVLKYHLPKTLAEAPPASWKDEARIIEDLGFDSLAMIETVFFVEDLFQISISNAEIIEVHTVGELLRFIRSKLAVCKS